MKPRPIACDYDGTLWWIDDPPKIGKFSGPVASLELGLRWLHDRANKQRAIAIYERVVAEHRSWNDYDEGQRAVGAENCVDALETFL